MREVPDSDNDIRRYQTRARMFAKAHGYPNDADDFAQEAYLARARERQAGLGRLFIDYLRRYYGSTRVSFGNVRAAERFSRMSLDDTVSTDVRRPLSECIGSFRDPAESIGKNWTDRIGLGRGGTGAENIKIEICTGSNPSELAEQYDVTESRISQIKADLKQDVLDAMALDHLSEYRDFKEKSQLEVDWITI